MPENYRRCETRMNKQNKHDRFKVVVIFIALVTTITSYSQTNNWDKVISIRISPGSLRQALETLERVGDTKFVYSQQDIEDKTLEEPKIYDRQPLSRILDDILFSRGLSYKHTNGRIAIKKYQPAAVGAIKGNVFDSKKEPLVGAAVRIEGTTIGAAVDLDGNFTLKNVPEGTYNLIISFVGYKTKRIENILVTAGNTATIETPMEEDTQSLQEIVVKGDIDVRYTPIKNSTEESLISDIKISDNIVTGISNIQITRSLDRDAADVMRRVPGVTVLNNFVLVRGMDPRYNVTYLNDMLVPSTESDSRAFSFNLIPSGLVDDIKIYKLPAPELPGGFGGGVIKVNTKKNQTTRRIQVDLSAQYRTGGASFDDYYTGSSDSKKDWIGMGLKDREMPTRFYDKNYKLPDISMYPQERMAAVRTLPSVNQIKKTEHGLDRRFSLSYYDSWRIGDIRLNNLTAVGYTYQRDNDRVSRADQGTTGQTPDFVAVDSIYSEQVRLSILEHLTVNLNDDHSINVNVFANRNAEDNTLLTAESRGEGSMQLIPGKPAPARKASFEYRNRDLLAAQLSGDHRLGNHNLHWFAGRIQQIDHTPDWQIFPFILDENASTENVALYDLDITVNMANNVPRQRWYTKENVKMGGLDYSIEVSPAFTLKAGTMLQWIDRRFDNFNYTFAVPVNNNSIGAVYQDVPAPWFNIASIFDDANFKDDGTGFNLLNSFTAESYAYKQNIAAAYISGRLGLMKNKVELYGGLRYENEYAQLYDASGKEVKGRSYYTYDPETGQGYTAYQDIPGPNFEYYLPSLNVTWNVSEKHKVRTGYGRTLDRPAYRERSTARFYSVRDGVNYEGNVVLDNAKLDNYDLRWEWYPTTSEFLAIGGYYKFIDNPIEIYEFGQGNYGRLTRSWRNNKWAELYGAEIEVRKNLGFIPLSFADRFSLILNASYIYTWVRTNIELKSGQTVPTRLTRPLTGSSPYVVNANLYYESPQNKTVVTFSYNYIGGRLISTAPAFVGDLYERDQQLFDIVVLYPIGKYLKVKAGVQNILNKDIVRWRDGNFDGEYTPGSFKDVDDVLDPTLAENTDYEGQRWNQGSYYSLGITLTF